MQALQVMLTEAERVRQHGFLQSELDRARTNTCAATSARTTSATKQRLIISLKSTSRIF